MSTTKKILTVMGRLPLLFVIDSILKGTLLNNAEVPADVFSQTIHFMLWPVSAASAGSNGVITMLLWFFFQCGGRRFTFFKTNILYAF